MHGRDRGIRHDPSGGRSGGSHPADAGNLGGHDCHVGRSQERVAPTGNVGADGVDGNVLLPEDDSWLDFSLEFRE
ncbi:hypothetical protein D3C86_2170680 [compost metagenome]